MLVKLNPCKKVRVSFVSNTFENICLLVDDVEIECKEKKDVILGELSTFERIGLFNWKNSNEGTACWKYSNIILDTSRGGDFLGYNNGMVLIG